MTESLVDDLARQLSLRTGVEFEVLRERYEVPVGLAPGRRTGKPKIRIRYYLHATREDNRSYTFRFGNGLSNNQMKFYLATLLDMIAMGFIPVPGWEK